MLLAEVLRTDRAGLVTGAARGLEAGEAARFDAFVARREGREPVAYILGRKPFRFLELHVDSRVLIPRPDTEVLVEAALELPEGRASSTWARAAGRWRCRSSTSAPTST